MPPSHYNLLVLTCNDSSRWKSKAPLFSTALILSARFSRLLLLYVQTSRNALICRFIRQQIEQSSVDFHTDCTSEHFHLQNNAIHVRRIFDNALKSSERTGAHFNPASFIQQPVRTQRRFQLQRQLYVAK